MALNIPMPEGLGESMERGSRMGSTLFKNLVEPELQRERAAQEWMQHAENHALRQEQEERLRQELAFAQQEHPLNLELLRAKIESENERAKTMAKGGNQRLSAAVQEALYLYGSLEDPRAQQYIFDRNKIISPDEYRPELGKEGVPEGAISFNNFTPAQKKVETDRQNKAIDQGESWKHILHQLDEADRILDENPHLSDTAASIIEESGGKNKGYINNILNRVSSKKDRTAIQSLDKIYSDIVLNLDSAMPGRGSVFKLQTITAAKGRSRNTNESNKYINNSLRKEGTPFVNYAKDLKKVKGKYALDFDRDKYSRIQEPDEVPDVQGVGPRKGHYLGEDYDIEPEDIEDFVEMGGVIL